ncbi:MAG: IS21 family transposase [Kofleriaceae bacterium]|nr:IS21 family transposase [Candidatus Methylomirabilis lanthanidiphila]
MLNEELWQEVHRLFDVEKWSKSAIARGLDVDVKTVRRCVRQAAWVPYQRAPQPETLVTAHAEFMRRRAPEVGHSARILFQELVHHHGYHGSYETVKRFVRPLREAQSLAERAAVRFETPPGLQSQIDWGQALIPFRAGRAVRHIFVLTLGFSRRAFYLACRDEQLHTFLEAHEQAFDYFGGHTREHLYDRPRTVCRPTEEGGVIWNATFKSFAQYWGFEPRLCRAYRARTKGKVESGVKYVKGNFLPGREFVDDLHLGEELLAWQTTIADQRIHGTTHERPIDRFSREQATLIVTAGHPAFRLEATYPRVVADDFLVSLDSNRYSVPFRLLGRTVEVQRREGRIVIRYHGAVVAEHDELLGRHQMRLLPEHGPGAIARNPRQPRLRHVDRPQRPWADDLAVEVRDLAVYDAWAAQAGGVS